MNKWNTHLYMVLISPLFHNSFLNELFTWILTTDTQFDSLHATYLKPGQSLNLHSPEHHAYAAGLRKPARDSPVPPRLIRMTDLCWYWSSLLSECGLILASISVENLGRQTVMKAFYREQLEVAVKAWGPSLDPHINTAFICIALFNSDRNPRGALYGPEEETDIFRKSENCLRSHSY